MTFCSSIGSGIGRDEMPLKEASPLPGGLEPAHAPLGEGLELLQGEGRLQSAEHPLDEPPVQRAHKFAMLLDEFAERTGPERDLDGLAALAPEPRLEPGLGHGLLEH